MALNVRNAIYADNLMARRGHIPFIPHLMHFWHMLIPHEYEFWLDQDLVWLKECDAVLRLPGESAGADTEVRIAKHLGMPIYHDVFDITDAEKDGKSSDKCART